MHKFLVSLSVSSPQMILQATPSFPDPSPSFLRTRKWKKMGGLNLFFLRNQQTACIPYMKMVATQKNYLLYTLAE